MNVLIDAIRHSAARRPDHIAIADAAGALSYRQLLAEVDAVAAQLRQCGSRIVALLIANSRAWITLDLACLAAGVPCLPLPDFFTDSQLRHALTAAGADCIVTDDIARAERLLPNGRPGSPVGGMAAIVDTAATPGAMPPGTCKITFTSGSTGTPKGVCLSADALHAVAASLLQVTAELPVERHLSVLPYATLLENIAGVYLPLLRGATVLAQPPRALGFNGARLENPPQFLQALEREQPHSLIVLPQFLQLFMQAHRTGWRPPASLRFIAVGGSKVPVPWLQRCRDLGLPVYEGYGLSECASVVALNTPAHTAVGSAGRVLPHCRVTVENGEIVVRGNSFLGYLGEPPRPAQAPVQTGDLGSLDGGFLHIEGRSKNLLVSSFGRNIAPEWPETALLASGLFRHCVVFGDARPHCIALLEPALALSSADIGAAVAAANRELPEYARIVRWFCPPLPLAATAGLLTSNGRPRRDAIAAHYREQIDHLYADAEVLS